MSNHPSRLVGTLMLCLSVCACKVGPEYKRPGVPLAENYTQMNPTQGVHLQLGADLANWWTCWNDPALQLLVHEAVRCNHSLKEAALRIQQARAQVGVTRSELFPQLQADGSYTLSKAAGMSGSTENWNLGTSLNWELDFFGRLRHYCDATLMDLEVERELYRDAYIILLADVASYYVTARAYQHQIEVAQENIKIRRHTLRMTQEKLAVGTSNQLDVQQALGSLQSVEAELPDLQAGLRHTYNRLSILLGLPPGSDVDALLDRKVPIPKAPELICVGMPAELLRRRPDIRAAEKRIIAQTERIGGAIGDLYPIFSLAGHFGVSASTFTGLWNSDSIQASISPGVRWNILNFGRYKSNVRLQEFKQKELILTYQQTVLKAAEEVDNTLASYVHEKERRSKIEQAVQSYTKALQYSEERYRAGTADFQRVLDSQREKLSFQTQLTVSTANVLQQVITLYRALGGGWSHPLPDGTCISTEFTAPTPQLAEKAKETDRSDRYLKNQPEEELPLPKREQVDTRK